MNKTIRNGVIASVFAIAIMTGVAVWVWISLPADQQIPVHWNAAGEPDRWGTRSEAMISHYIVIGVSIFTAVLLAFMPKIDPRKANLEKSSKVYGISWIATMVLLACISVGTGWLKVSSVNPDQSIEASAIPFVRFVIAGTALLFLILGNYLPKTRPNWFLGIRTPWTLSSNQAWEKTHRLGGRLFMVVGVIGFVSAFLLSGLALALVVPILAVSSALTSAIYSYFAWRDADDGALDADYIV
ncbi:MAG: SdpI family protein [Pseudomonadota bacterium]